MVQAASLRAVLSEARPSWSEKDLLAVEEKLSKIGVSTAEQLAELLAEGLNKRLLKAGQKAFNSETLAALRQRLEKKKDYVQTWPVEPPVEPPAPARATFSPSAAFGRPEALGETSLIKAVRQGDVRTATYLLEQRANPNEKDHFGETALMEAAAQGQPALVKMLLEQGATLEYQSPSGLTARKLAEEHEVLKPLGRSVRKHVKTKETR